MLACSLGHQALIDGKTVLSTTAGQLLGDPAALDSDSLLRRRIRHHAAPDLLLIDEWAAWHIRTGMPICCSS